MYKQQDVGQILIKSNRVRCGSKIEEERCYILLKIEFYFHNFKKKKTKKKQYKIIGLKIKIFIIHNELMNLYSSIF